MTHSDFIKIIKKTWQTIGLSGHSGQVAGLPDLLVMYKGRPHFCEVKVDKDRLSDNQKYFLAKDHKSFVLWLQTNDSTLTIFDRNNVDFFFEYKKLSVAINAKLKFENITDII